MVENMNMIGMGGNSSGCGGIGSGDFQLEYSRKSTIDITAAM